ncbi:MAG: hypothetical protein ABSE66_09825 [Thermoplasmata archaeon]|jgi:hypothetical protein
MKRLYTPREFSGDSLAVIARANEICDSYAAQGYELTLAASRWPRVEEFLEGIDGQ